MKKRKVGALGLVLAMTASLMSGCAMPNTSGDVKNDTTVEPVATTEKESKAAESKTTDGEKITLRMVDWSDSSMARREEFNKKYMEEHPNITIEYTMLTVDQFKNTIVTMVKSGEGPDLFPIPVGMTLSTVLKEDWYQPLDEYVTDEFRATLDPAIYKEGVTISNGKLYSIPETIPSINTLLFYNKDILEQAGVTKVPETYSEFAAACKQITEAGKGQFYGLIEGGKQLNRLDLLVRALANLGGGKLAAYAKVLTVDGKAPYDSDAMLAAMGLMKQLAADGSIHPDTLNISAPEAREMFAQGQAAFLCQGMWCISPWKQNYPDLNYSVMAIPVPDGGAKGYVPQETISPWMGLYKQSKHPKEAAEYLMALFSEEGGYQSNCVSDGNYVSIVPSVNEKYMTSEIMKTYYDIATKISKDAPIATVRDEKAYDFYAEVKDVQPGLGAIVQGVLSQSITDYQSELTKLSEASTIEWQRAATAVGLDYATFEFPNWDPMKAYTEEDYAALK